MCIIAHKVYILVPYERFCPCKPMSVVSAGEIVFSCLLSYPFLFESVNPSDKA